MSRSVEPTLLSLLPTLPDAASLPSQLVDLASTLLTQSRHNASTLKAEEEVARVYACTHIACERLKTILNLPEIQVRPPVHPRIYKRLYTHLDHILPANSVGRTGRIRIPSGKAREAAGGISGSGGSAQKIRARPTPTKEAALTQFIARPGGTPRKVAVDAVGGANKSRHTLPSWVNPMIRSLCLGQESLGRTVLAGMHTIVVPHSRGASNVWLTSHVAPVLAAVYFMVATQFIILKTGQEITSAQYAEIRRDLLRSWKHARQETDVQDIDVAQFWDGWTSLTNKDIDEAIVRITEGNWTDQEWYTGIKHLVAASRKTDEKDIYMNPTSPEPRSFEGGRAHNHRGDTMSLRRWLMTEQSRENYHQWKEEIMSKAHDLDNAPNTVAMDLDESS